MIHISPEQKVYTQLRYAVEEELGYSVYSYLPDSKAEYPFVVLGEQFSQSVRTNKDRRNKDVQTTIHVWHNDWRQRGTVSKMLREIELAIIREYGVDGEDIAIQINPDNSTGSDLLHGILETDIRI